MLKLVLRLVLKLVLVLVLGWGWGCCKCGVGVELGFGVRIVLQPTIDLTDMLVSGLCSLQVGLGLGSKGPCIPPST